MGSHEVGASAAIMLNNGGAIYTKQSDVVEYDYQFTKLSGSGSHQIVCATFVKVNNNILNSAAILNSTDNFIYIWLPSSSGIDTGIVTGSDWRISTKVNGLYYNGTDVFYPFSGTPTPTPTVTSPPTGKYDATFYIKDNSNNAAISDAYVEMLNHDSANQKWAGYTNASGAIEFLQKNFPTYAGGYTRMEARVTKANYQYQIYLFNPVASFTHTIYLVPDTGPNPVIPATVNITLHSIDSSNGNANLANAYVEVYPNVPVGGIIDFTAKVTGFTNASGLITFQNVQTSAYNRIKTTKTGYSTDDYSIGVTPLSDFQHNAYLTTFGVTPTVTPLPTTGNYTLTISPTAVSNGGNTTATISSAGDPSLASIQQIWYSYTSADNTGYDFFESGSYSKALQYSKLGGTWFGYDFDTSSFTNNKGGTIPNPANLIFSGDGGTKTVYCTITLTNGVQYELKGTVVVGAGTTWITTNVHAIEALSGGQLGYVEIDILNENTGIWKNGTYSTGRASISTPAGNYLSFYGSLAGYDPASSLHKIAVSSPSYQLRFYETGVAPGAGNQTFYVTVESQSGTPLSAASVAISEIGNGTQTQTTSSGGLATFTLKKSTVYTYRVTKPGYGIGAGSFATDTADVGSTHIQLTSPTVTPTPTITQTVVPTNAAGNYTGFWGPIANAGQAMGATPDLILLLMASLLIFIGFCVGGWSASAYSPSSSFSGSGSMAGGVFGFVLSCLFGFIPIVWVISIIILGVFFFIFFSRG